MKTKHVLVLISAGYVLVTAAYSLLTPAWEANDEAAHVAYIEHVVDNNAIPRIGIEAGHEAHQPPLYYVLASLWQRLLGIPAFSPDPRPRETAGAPIVPNRASPQLMLSHNYTPTQRTHAIYVHELRAFSVLLGLGTVLITFFVTRVVVRTPEIAAAAAAFVALLPKFNVVSGTVTNDALVIPLCSLALFLALLYLVGDAPSSTRRSAFALGMGAALGAAAITKYNSLPLFLVLPFGVLLARVPVRRRLLDLALSVGAAAAVSGWWFARNLDLYGDVLARDASHGYLKETIPGLIAPVPWTDTERFLYFVPERLLQSIWYTGGWNQLFAPFLVNLGLSFLAAVAVFAALRALVVGGRRCGIDRRAGALLVLSALAGLVSVLLVAKDANQAEGRIAYVGLTAFAAIAVLGLVEAVGGSPRVRRWSLALWPLILAIFNAYVITQFLVPLRHL